MSRFNDFGNDLYTGKRSIDFIARRRTWYLLAGAMVLLSLLAVGLNGLNAGIEFRGGQDIRVSGVKDTSDLIAKDAMAPIVGAGEEVRVSAVGDDGVRVQTSTLTPEEADEAAAALAKAYGVSAADNVSVSLVGPSWGEDVTNKALQGLIVFLVLVAALISVYFRTWKMAAAALAALIHDLVITVGIYAAVGFEVTPASVIGFLTILGYSLYDTVVVYDKVRENTIDVTSQTKRTYAESANLAINQTLVRSINTSVVALLPIGSILFVGAFLLGAGTLRDIALSLFVGIAAGTYSSIFIATPLLVDLRSREPVLVEHAAKVLRRRARQASGESEEQDSSETSGDRPTGGAPQVVVTTRSGGAAPSGPLPTGGQRVQPRKGDRRPKATG